MTCGTCGYAASDHTGPDQRCPLCACGLTPDVHEQAQVVIGGEAGIELRCFCECGIPSFMHIPPGQLCGLCAEGMPHACVWARWGFGPCSGRRSQAESSDGRWLVLRRGTFKPAEDVQRGSGDWRQVMAEESAARRAAAAEARREHAPEAVGPPRVAARAPLGLHEVAAGQGRQARGLGRKAVASGCRAVARYWVAGDGTEGSAVQLARGDLRGVAVWTRKAGEKGWKTDVVYVWRPGSGEMPRKVTLKALEEMILNE